MIIKTKDFGGFENFNAILKRISKFAYPDDTRWNLNGIYFEFQFNKTILTATNGLSLITETFDVKNEEEGNFILKLKAIEELTSKFEEFEFEFTRGDKTPYVIFDNSKRDWVWNTDYADYKKAIPTTTTELIKINKTKCLQDLKVLLENADFQREKKIKELINQAQNEAIEIEYTSLEDCISNNIDSLDDIIEKLQKMGVECSYDLPDLEVKLNIAFNPETKKIFINDNGTYSLEKSKNSIISFDIEHFYNFVLAVSSEEICIYFDLDMFKEVRIVKSQNGNQIILLMAKNK